MSKKSGNVEKIEAAKRYLVSLLAKVEAGEVTGLTVVVAMAGYQPTIETVLIPDPSD